MSSSAENARHHERINIKPEVAAVCNQSEELARFVVEPQLCRVRIYQWPTDCTFSLNDDTCLIDFVY